VRWALGLWPLLALACSADDFLVGGSIVTGPPLAPVATYRVDQCKNTVTGAPVAVPQAINYFLVASPDGRFVLHEIDATGSGAAIDNYWAEGDKDFWAVRIRMISTAMTFELPRDRTQPGTRRIYEHDGFEVTKVNNGFQITGTPSTECVMTPTGTPAAAAPSPPSGEAPSLQGTAAPPPIGGCQSDRECKGGRICASGTCIAPSQSGQQTPKPALVAGGCQSDGECKGGRVCDEGKCVSPEQRVVSATKPAAPTGGCQSDSECKGGRICRDGVCTSSTPSSCRGDKDCPGEEICVAARCKRP
jgi:hypothetical protein